jgi:hypothetical protein
MSSLPSRTQCEVLEQREWPVKRSGEAARSGVNPWYLGEAILGPPDWVEEESVTDPRVISPTQPSDAALVRPAILKRGQPSFRKRTGRCLIIFSMGVAATLAWQSYGDTARQMIASSDPQLGWLAPQTAAAATAPEVTSPAAPASSVDSQEFKSLLMNLALVRQSMDKLAAQFVASQQQIAGELSKLKATEQGIFEKISSAPPRPAASPARKPVPVPPQVAQEVPVR